MIPNALRHVFRSTMNRRGPASISRRRLLEFLAGSPLLASAGWSASWSRNPDEGEPDLQALDAHLDELMASADDAINVFDFEPVARNKLPPAHYGYLAGGVEDDRTLRVNREAFAGIYLRPRRLVDVSEIDTSAKLLGQVWETPIVLAPVGSQKAFHPEGEIAVARAAGSERHLQILSTVTTSSVEDVAAARGAPVWYQLYPTSSWTVARTMLRRAESAGSPVVVLTVDLPTTGNRETEQRFRRKDDRDCAACHAPGIAGFIQRKPMFEGTEASNLGNPLAPGMTWSFVDRLKDETDMKVLLKGIVTAEDARLCVEHGVGGIIVSNHGGRAEESGRATIDSLPEVVEAVDGRIPVLVDGGFRRGSDIFKALALGADAVCIGRPYLWGLAAFGEAGVAMVLKLLRAELRDVMMFAGTSSLEAIRRTHVGLS